MKKVFLHILVGFFCMSIYAQPGITFQDISLDQALERAKRENKSVFVDAYASWCIPCKKMDKIFKDPTLGTIYNNNYINIKLDTDLESNKNAKLKYDIVFLPTMMVLDPNGIVRYKVDKVLSKNELLEIANLTVDPNLYYVSEATKISSSPVSSNNNTAIKKQLNKSDISVQKGEKILAVLDMDSGNLPPEVLYQESYDRIERMDGSHRKYVDEYLKSQADWTSEKNTRFVFDFVDGSNKNILQYFLDNRLHFGKFYSKKQVKKTTEMLVFKKLYQTTPRPSLEEATQLMSYIYKKNPEKKAANYFAKRQKL